MTHNRKKKAPKAERKRARKAASTAGRLDYEVPENLPPRELFRRLEVGLTTLRDQCLARNENDTDPELGARFVQLFELSIWECPIDPAALINPADDKMRRFPLGKIARICSGLLNEVAEKRRQKL